MLIDINSIKNIKIIKSINDVWNNDKKNMQIYLSKINDLSFLNKLTSLLFMEN